MLVVGARLLWHASLSISVWINISDDLSNREFFTHEIPISLIPSFLRWLDRDSISLDSPLFDIHITISSLPITQYSVVIPKCKKIDFEPVEFKVAEIFIPIIALFPIPVITILPLQDFNIFIISQKLESIALERLEIDFDSKVRVSNAIFLLSVD